MTCTTVLSSIGLVMDMIGVLLLWKFGLPEPISRKGHVNLISEKSDQTEIAKAKVYDRLAFVAVSLLLLGFALQLLSNFVK